MRRLRRTKTSSIEGDGYEERLLLRKEQARSVGRARLNRLHEGSPAKRARDEERAKRVDRMQVGGRPMTRRVRSTFDPLRQKSKRKRRKKLEKP